MGEVIGGHTEYAVHRYASLCCYRIDFGCYGISPVFQKSGDKVYGEENQQSFRICFTTP